MECQISDSKKVFKVFDAAKRKRGRKKRDGFDDNVSVATDESTGNNVRRVTSAKASLQDMPNADGDISGDINKRDRDSSPSVSRSPNGRPRSPRRNRRLGREGVSLALKAGLVSTPRSISPQQDGDGIDSIPKDEESFMYAFLEEAIKRDKKKHRHSKKHEGRTSRNREISASLEQHPTRDDHSYREKDKPKEKSRQPAVDQAALLETFAKLCAQFSEKSTQPVKEVPRTLSHKSLQCEVLSRRDSYDIDLRPTRHRSREQSRDVSPTYTRSYDNFRTKVRSRENVPMIGNVSKDKYLCCPYDKELPRYSSKFDMERTKAHDERYGERSDCKPVRSSMDQYYVSRGSRQKEYKNYDDIPDRRYGYYPDDRRKYCEQKCSRSFDMQKSILEDKMRKTSRSDGFKEKDYDEKHTRERRKDDKNIKDRLYYDDRDLRDRNYPPNKERRIRHNIEKFERSSIASREEDYRDRERYSERERDSGLSVADGETSTISGRSNYLKVVKQEITEQREAMDKMMKLWKELMKCFKGVQQTSCRDKEGNDTAENMQESAAAQLKLWRECMRRYETVARDVGDTDARLMEEINKQRTEMAEMGSMWQECLQRYRDMSNEFNTLKQQLATSESPSRAPQQQLVCAEGEGAAPPAPYRMQPHMAYPPMPPMPSGYPGSPLRSRASAPPTWWWNGEGQGQGPEQPPPPRRRSSPDSSRERRHRHKDRERDTPRYKEKSSKPSGARSEHRHRKR